MLTTAIVVGSIRCLSSGAYKDVTITSEEYEDNRSSFHIHTADFPTILRIFNKEHLKSATMETPAQSVRKSGDKIQLPIISG